MTPFVEDSAAVEACDNSSEDEDEDNAAVEASDNSSEDEDDSEESLDKDPSTVEPGKRKFNQISNDADTSDVNKKIKTEPLKKSKPPTAEELSRLKETENLFHSNLFRLQIEETLKESKPKDAILESCKVWLKQLKRILWNLEETESLKVSELKWLKEKRLKSPIKLGAADLEEEFVFKKPSKIETIGSFSIGYFIGSSITIDLAVQIPQICFGKKDHQDEKYHRKRSLYLCHIANALLEEEGNVVDKDLYFTLQNSNAAKPILVVKPVGSLGKKVTVNISTVLSMSVFKPTKLSPSRNNVKSSWFYSKEANKEDEPATPFYNASIMEDMVTLSNESLRKEVFSKNPKFKDAMILLKIWLRQRKLDEGFGCFSSYTMSMFLVYLYQIRRLNKFMSSYQILRNVWIVLNQTDWTAEGISLKSIIKKETDDHLLPAVSDFLAAFDVVFVDSTGLHNICANLSETTYLKVKSESALSLECLDRFSVNSFYTLFMAPISFLQHYDNVIHFNDPSVIKKTVQKFGSEKKRLDYTRNIIPQFITLVISLIKESLGERLSKIGVHTQPSALKWSLNSKPSSGFNSVTVSFGLILNPETAFSVVLKGPDANLAEAKTFREFWGPKSELRRFRDGTVCETTVWAEDDAPLNEKRATTQHMITYLLQRKLNLEKSQYQYVSNQMETFLQNNQFIPHGFKYGTGEEACLKVMSTFDRLEKQLRNLKNLPLDVSTLVGTSPVFRYADVFPPLAQTLSPNSAVTTVEEGCVIFNGKPLLKCSNYVPAIDGVIHLIGSGKWPDDLAAVKRIQAAFYVKLAELLRTHHRLVCQPYPDYLAVIKDGFVFRLKIFYPGEVTLMKRGVNAEGLLEYHDTENSLSVEKNLVHLPQISGAMHGLHLKYPALGPACALSKRWLNSQLLDDSHFPSIVTELLVASLFTSPHPHPVAFNPQTVFLRFLALLSLHDWNAEPLIVNFNSELSGNVIVELEKKFRDEREDLPPLVIFTPYDETGVVWTKTNPSPLILIRTIKLASQALQKFEAHLLQADAASQILGLFVPPLDSYNILIHLKSCMLPRQWYAIDAPNSSKHQLQPSKSSKLPITDFDPAQCYLRELRNNYGEFGLFFHDTFGGNVVGVLLKPDVLKPCEFKAKNFNGRCPSESNQHSDLLFNIDALIEDFKVIGEGIVDSITLQK